MKLVSLVSSELQGKDSCHRIVNEIAPGGMGARISLIVIPNPFALKITSKREDTPGCAADKASNVVLAVRSK